MIHPVLPRGKGILPPCFTGLMNKGNLLAFDPYEHAAVFGQPLGRQDVPEDSVRTR